MLKNKTREELHELFPWGWQLRKIEVTGCHHSRHRHRHRRARQHNRSRNRSQQRWQQRYPAQADY